ncbi:MAG: alpha/beta hydrolase family protein [Egibacteraceae bacterium]
MPALPAALRIPLSPPQAVSETDATLWPAGASDGQAAVILAHGAGADQTWPMLRAIAAGLAADHPVLTFNFAYAQAGRRRPDPAPRLAAAWRDVIAGARDRLGAERPLVIGGRSMGGRIASLLAAQGVRGSPPANQGVKGSPPANQGMSCAGLLLLGYPLHPAGRPEQLRTAHWPALRMPILFVQGDRDALCRTDLLARERAAHLGHVRSDLHVLAGGDHSFKVRGRSQDAVVAEIVSVATAWLASLPR